ncbi:MAG: SnoaL-like domain-containing protein [Lutimonas sp.]|jgi:hypothetical protein
MKKICSTLIEKISDLNDMIIQGRVLEAFDRFYHDEVCIEVNANELIEGKKKNRTYKEQFLNGILEWHSANPLKVSIGEGITMVEWLYDYTDKLKSNKRIMHVAVQEWQDGKIIKEKLYYNP